MFDEPSSYLDVKQRLNAARMIRSLRQFDNYIVIVEHDLSILDYLSDFVCCLYGKPGAYGVVTMPFSVREGINIFLAGFIPTENMHFREFELNFRLKDGDDQDEKKKKESATEGKNLTDEQKKRIEELAKQKHTHYPALEKKLGPFHLKVEAGSFAPSETIVMLG